MYSEEELRISNKSYIDKDFGTIYPELLELATILSKRWNPTTDNESSPGVVLLKLAAFVADKDNYNIDKNILERFALSATQESSMRKICDTMGYSMNYYIAPTVEVTVRYSGNLEEDFGTSVTLNALETVFGNSEEEESINYILTQPISLDANNLSQTRLAMQGVLRVLDVNTSGDVTDTSANTSLIHLNNLDDNNRIYFPETGVAQNGVFICYPEKANSGEFWEVTTNLNYHTYPDEVFKFGFDSARCLPYIEFPTYISRLIGNGLYIRYIVTDGQLGNISARTLNTIVTSNVDSNTYENFYVNNASATSTGKDPETNDEAYQGYKKTIGTFNTLVTCRDYANAIYNMLTSSGDSSLVSNVQVCDRRDDFNYSKRVVSFSDTGRIVENLTNPANLNAFDLCCYPLKPLVIFDDVEKFNLSFTPLVSGNGLTLPYEITNKLEDSYKTISHDYKELAAKDVYAFKNMVGLSAKIVTTYKVNANEQVEILTNIRNSLIKNFNARQVEYGVEIPYDSILDVMMNADERISQVILSEPDLKTVVLFRDGTTSELDNDLSTYCDLLAQNILNGNVSLFEFNDDFLYEFGQEKISGIDFVNKNISKIDTALNLEFASDDIEHTETLLKNEVVQILSPNLVTELTYPSYCYYRWLPTTQGTNIASGTNYKLKSDDVLTILYTDENNVRRTVLYTANTIIKPTMLLKDVRNASQGEIYDIDGVDYLGFGTDTLAIQKINTASITANTPCYWIMNNDSNKINWDANNKYMLQSGEYFFYTDSGQTQLISLQSGTLLEIPSDLKTMYSWEVENVSVEDVLTKGIASISDKWLNIAFSSLLPLNIQENTIITLSESDQLIVKNNSGTSLVLTNTLQPISSGISVSYKFSDESTPKLLESLDLGPGYGWSIRSRLDINVTKDEPQIINDGLETTVSTRQSVTFYQNGSSSSTGALNTTGQLFNFNGSLQLVGGNNIDLTIDESYPYAICCYTLQSGATPEENNLLTAVRTRSEEGYAYLSITDIINNTNTIEFNLPVIGKDAMVMIYLNAEPDENNYVSLSCSGYYPTYYYNDSTVTKLSKGINVIHLEYSNNSNFSLTFTVTGTLTGTIVLGTLDFINGYNSVLNLSDANIESTLLPKIAEEEFYYNNKIENSKIIESDDLKLPYALYDANNRANKMTISQIDFSDSVYDVTIVRNSRL